MEGEIIMRRKFTAMLLCAAMILTLLPVSAAERFYEVNDAINVRVNGNVIEFVAARAFPPEFVFGATGNLTGRDITLETRFSFTLVVNPDSFAFGTVKSSATEIGDRLFNLTAIGSGSVNISGEVSYFIDAAEHTHEYSVDLVIGGGDISLPDCPWCGTPGCDFACGLTDVIPGDVDGDGFVTCQDAREVHAWLLGEPATVNRNALITGEITPMEIFEILAVATNRDLVEIGEFVGLNTIYFCHICAFCEDDANIAANCPYCRDYDCHGFCGITTPPDCWYGDCSNLVWGEWSIVDGACYAEAECADCGWEYMATCDMRGTETTIIDGCVVYYGCTECENNVSDRLCSSINWDRPVFDGCDKSYMCRDCGEAAFTQKICRENGTVVWEWEELTEDGWYTECRGRGVCSVCDELLIGDCYDRGTVEYTRSPCIKWMECSIRECAYSAFWQDCYRFEWEDRTITDCGYFISCYDCSAEYFEAFCLSNGTVVFEWGKSDDDEGGECAGIRVCTVCDRSFGSRIGCSNRYTVTWGRRTVSDGLCIQTGECNDCGRTHIRGCDSSALTIAEVGCDRIMTCPASGCDYKSSWEEHAWSVTDSSSCMTVFTCDDCGETDSWRFCAGRDDLSGLDWLPWGLSTEGTCSSRAFCDKCDSHYELYGHCRINGTLVEYDGCIDGVYCTECIFSYVTKICNNCADCADVTVFVPDWCTVCYENESLCICPANPDDPDDPDDPDNPDDPNDPDDPENPEDPDEPEAPPVPPSHTLVPNDDEEGSYMEYNEDGDPINRWYFDEGTNFWISVDPTHTLVREGDFYIVLDDSGVPLGRWIFDEETEVWIFEEYDVPLASFGLLPQTGMVQWPVPVLSILGVLLIVLGRFLTRKRRTGAWD
jgi:hypothetical protein